MSDLDAADESAAALEDAADTVVDAITDAADHAAADTDADLSRDELLQRAFILLADAEAINIPDSDAVSALRADVDALDESVEEKVTDLRSRFVELYRDVETKAPADHVHESTAARLDSLAADLAAVDDRIDQLASTTDVDEQVETVRSHLDDVEDRLDALEDADLSRKTSRVARAVVTLQQRLDAVEQTVATQRRLDTLVTDANRHGVTSASCTNCDETVALGLLCAPVCPHCDREFVDVDPNPGFFRSPKLVVADPPALDGSVADTDEAPPQPADTDDQRRDAMTAQSAGSDRSPDSGDDAGVGGDADVSGTGSPTARQRPEDT